REDQRTGRFQAPRAHVYRLQARGRRLAGGLPTQGPEMTRGRARRRIVAFLVLAALVAAGWRLSPGIAREIQLHLARRAIADGRLDDAEARLDLLISEEPASTRPRLLRVRVFREQG